METGGIVKNIFAIPITIIGLSLVFVIAFFGFYYGWFIADKASYAILDWNTNKVILTILKYIFFGLVYVILYLLPTVIITILCMMVGVLALKFSDDLNLNIQISCLVITVIYGVLILLLGIIIYMFDIKNSFNANFINFFNNLSYYFKELPFKGIGTAKKFGKFMKALFESIGYILASAVVVVLPAIFIGKKVYNFANDWL